MKRSVRQPIVRVMVKHPWLTAGALATGIGAAVAIVVILGVAPIGASSGHWWITAQLLDFAKIRSVQTYSFGIDVPELTETDVVRGASHYAIGCEPCHGGPGRDLPAVMAGMTPPPPALTEAHIARWTPANLFTIVKHGIKFTGMPAWPAQTRDDEVWAVVAFLRRMPALDADQYRRLTAGEPPDPPAPKVVRDLCSRCHGVDGTGRGEGTFPSLAGQRATYIAGSLRAFTDRRRFSGIMSAVVSGLDDALMREAASYYDALPPRRGNVPADAAAVTRGERIVRAGIPERDIPPCAECHGPSAQPKNPAYPRLASQHREYLRRQIQLLKERRRGGTANVSLMHAFVDRLQVQDVRDAAAYFSTLAD
jgi:cytochrome c553